MVHCLSTLRLTNVTLKVPFGTAKKPKVSGSPIFLNKIMFRSNICWLPAMYLQLLL